MPLRGLIPKSDTHLLLARDLSGPMGNLTIADVDVVAIASKDDASAGTLEAFASEQGFPDRWALDMLGEGATALLAHDTRSSQTLAMSWSTAKLFEVVEIGARLDPDGGVYLFGDFVAPAQRGRNLQRMLVAERLRRAAGAAFACTIIHPENVPSLRSYHREGFTPVARFTRRHWMGRTWAACDSTSDSTIVRFTLERDDVLRARRP
jgi:GNAT superfamily N-acetyltransferase